MADYLLSLDGGLAKLRRMVLAYASGKSDLEVLELAGLGTPGEFFKALSAHVGRVASSE